MFHKPTRKVTRVYVSASESNRPEHNTVAFVNEVAAARGMADGSVHYFINKDGINETGLPIEKSTPKGAAPTQSSVNIVLAGLNRLDFNLKQYDALRNLCAQIDAAYEGDITFEAINAPTFDLDAELGLENGKLAQKYRLSDEKVAAIKEVDPSTLIQLGSVGEEVTRIQKKLKIEKTGTFDSRTDIALRAFQAENGLRSHGILDEDTQAALLK